MMHPFRPLGVLAAATLLAGCSAIVGGFQECEEDRDCLALGDDFVCVQPELFCTTDPDPFGPDCRTLLGDAYAKDPRALRLGALLPLSDVEGQPLAEGEALMQSLRLALEEVNNQGGLGPTGFNLRVCDTHGDAARAAAEAGYLGERGVVALFTVGSEELRAVAEKAVPASMLLLGLEASADDPGVLPEGGLVWRPLPDASPSPELAEGFRTRYRQRFQGDPDASASSARAYDALYCTALAAIASAGPSGETPLTGAQLAQGLSRLVSGSPHALGPLGFSTVRGQLQRGQSVDVEGASGALSFAPVTGAP